MAARVGDCLECMGPAGGTGGSTTASTDDVSIEIEKELGEARERKRGQNKIDERRGPKGKKGPLFKAKYESKTETSGEVWKTDDGRWEGLTGKYEYGAEAEAEVRSLEDMRGTLSAGAGLEGSAAQYTSPEFRVPGFKETAGKVDMLTGEVDANLQAHIDLKKRQIAAGGELGGGVSVIEGELPFETEQLRIPFTDLGISLAGKASGSVLTAQAKAFAGVRFDPKNAKKMFSLRTGAKLGAFLAGLGLTLEINIGPMAPATMPLDEIAAGSPTVDIGTTSIPVDCVERPIDPGPPSDDIEITFAPKEVVPVYCDEIPKIGDFP